ncbi:MAG: TonB-dependent receptor [Candidatus Zhuqueibacterota bacterium]
MRMHSSGVTLLLLVFIVLVSQPGFAGTTGKISGIVRDAQSGELLPGVNILIEGTTMGAAADMNGYYVILNIPPGKYTVTASMIGYEKSTLTNVKVSIDLTTTLDFQLSTEVLELGKEVVVIAERPMVTKDLTSAEAHVDAEQIENLPVQEVSEVLALQSGVTVDRDGGIHIRGGRSSEVAYWVDGISVTDVYDGSISVQVENESVQELQVISGTFNAEYGQAMSGIVNIVTKEGGSNYHLNLSGYSGDFVSGNNDIFYNIDDVNPFANYNAQASMDGPLPFAKNINFFATTRYNFSDGWLYGQNRFLPDGSAGDFEPVAMDFDQKLSAQAKLTAKLTPTMKLSIGALGSQMNYRDYNHGFKWNPTGDVEKFEDGYNLSLLFTHALSERSFYTVNVSNYYKRFNEYLYENSTDTRYVHPDSMIVPAYAFLDQGTNLHHFKRNTNTWVGKLDYTVQLNQLHQVKAGLEGRLHELFLDDYTLVAKRDASGREITPFEPDILDINTPNHNMYTRRPVELSLYFQDKIEYKSMIVNIGMRFDYFNANGKVLNDPSDPNIYNPFKPENIYHNPALPDSLLDLPGNLTTFDDRLSYWYRDVEPKYQVSPRFGIAYPITDRGTIHFSYGHFLQIPNFLYLYANPGYKVSSSTGIQGPFGNADLKPQKTVMYEIGLQQQISDQIAIDLTGFYRDVRNWVTTSVAIETYIPGVAYSNYINKDYANVRGVTLAFDMRPVNDFSMNVDYTYQVAEGSNSDPNEEFYALQSQAEPTKMIIPLDWDQTHTLNGAFSFAAPWGGFSLLGRYGSAFPYSPSISVASRQGQNLSTGLQANSRRKPVTMTFDLKFHKSIRFRNVKAILFANIFNLLDRKNEINVFGDTGRANNTLEAANVVETEGIRVNTVDEYLVYPHFYSAPREIQIGLEIDLSNL